MLIGALSLTATAGDPVIVEILPDDFPDRYPFLDEPRLERANGLLDSELTYGQMTWQGFPLVDAQVDVEIVDEGNKEARFQWSADDGENFEENGVLVPLGGSHALGDTGFTAAFAASPAPEYETEYTFTGSGEASKSGAGPTVTISGSGSIDGLIRIQTGIGSFRYRINGGSWSSTASIATLPIAVPGPGVELNVAPEDHQALLLEAGARFDFRARGFFHMRLTRGEEIELYERLRVDDLLWFVSPDVPERRRSKLLASAAWVGTTRPVVGSYILNPE